MNRLTITQRIGMIITYSKNDILPEPRIVYALRGDYDLHKRQTTQAIVKILKKFLEAGVVTNIVRPKDRMCRLLVILRN